MPPLSSLQTTLRFGDFDADLRTGELRKHGIRIKLQVQPFQVLQILLEHPGEVVTREELQRRIWPADTFVDFDQGLNNAVKKLRVALGDDAEKPRFIETLSKRGYRFIGSVHNGAAAAVTKEGPTAAPSTEPRAPETSRKRFELGLGLVAGAVVAIALMVGFNVRGMRDRLLARGASPRIQSLAVLPLQNLSNDPAQEYFSDGMTDALITDLAQIGSLKVISRTSSMQYKQTKKTLPEIAHELNVDGIVEGTVQRSGERVRITAQLIHGPSDKHVWANSYEGDMRDLFALERDVTNDIARQIQVRLDTSNHGLPKQLPSVNPKVLDPYLEGNYYLNRFSRGGGDQDKRKAADLFQQVIDTEPNFAPAYVGLARAHLDLTQSSTEDLAIVKQAAEKAVQLDSASSDGWLVFGEIKEEILFDWSGAEADYRKATILNPNNASAHRNLGEFLGEMGRLDEGLKECQIAQELDPNEDHLSRILYLRREYDRGIAILQIILKTHPDDGYQRLMLYDNYTKKGMYNEAVEQLAQALDLFGLSDAAAHIHRSYAGSGYPGAMRQWAKELEHLHDTNQGFLPVNLALTYAALGEKDRAFYWLEQAYQHREIVGTDIPLAFLVRDPMADPLRSDPRFAELVRRVGLEP